MLGKSFLWWVVIALIAWVAYIHFVRKVPVKK